MVRGPLELIVWCCITVLLHCKFSLNMTSLLSLPRDTGHGRKWHQLSERLRKVIAKKQVSSECHQRWATYETRLPKEDWGRVQEPQEGWKTRTIAVTPCDCPDSGQDRTLHVPKHVLAQVPMVAGASYLGEYMLLQGAPVASRHLGGWGKHGRRLLSPSSALSEVSEDRLLVAD
jgi:hypothetical protein